MARRRPPPKKGSIKAVVTDVDGTLTDAQRRIVPEAAKLLRRLETRGIPVVLATGNVLPIALAIHRSLGLAGPIVAENGGLLYSRNDGLDRVVRLADRRVAMEAYRHLRRSGLDVHRLFTDRWRETEVGLEPTVSERAIRALLRGFPVTVESTGYAIHLMSKGAGKVPAIRRALRPLGVDLDECLAAGDGDNDVPMLLAAAWSISFASASPRARRAADFVSRASYACGFVEGLKASGIVVM